MGLIGTVVRLGIRFGMAGAAAAGAGYLLDKARSGRERALAARRADAMPDGEAPAAGTVAPKVDFFAEADAVEPVDTLASDEDALRADFESLPRDDAGEFMEDVNDAAFVVMHEDEGQIDLENVDEREIANGIAALEEADDRRHFLNE